MPTSVDRSRVISAPRDRVWDVLAAFDRLSDWAPDAEHSAPLTMPATGPGAKRRVQNGRVVLVETIVAWEQPAQLAYRIEGLPPRLGSITFDWRLEPQGTMTAAKVTVTVNSGARPPQQLVERVVARRFAGVASGLLDALDAHLAPTGAPT